MAAAVAFLKHRNFVINLKGQQLSEPFTSRSIAKLVDRKSADCEIKKLVDKVYRYGDKKESSNYLSEI